MFDRKKSNNNHFEGYIFYSNNVPKYHWELLVHIIRNKNCIPEDFEFMRFDCNLTYLFLCEDTLNKLGSFIAS